MLGISNALGLSQTYVDAQRIVTALERARTDESYYDTALAILSEYTDAERQEIANKAIALGADPDIINNFMQTLSMADEVIEITDTAPSPIRIGGKAVSWWTIAASVVGIIGGAWTQAKYGKLLFKRL